MNSVPIKINPHLKIKNGEFIILYPPLGYLKTYTKSNQLIYPVWSEWTSLPEESLRLDHAQVAREVAGWWKGAVVMRKPLPLVEEEEDP